MGSRLGQLASHSRFSPSLGHCILSINRISNILNALALGIEETIGSQTDVVQYCIEGFLSQIECLIRVHIEVSFDQGRSILEVDQPRIFRSIAANINHNSRSWSGVQLDHTRRSPSICSGQGPVQSYLYMILSEVREGHSKLRLGTTGNVAID